MAVSRSTTAGPSICFVTTTPITLSAFVMPTAEHLASEGGFEVTLVSNESSALSVKPGSNISLHSVPMTRGIGLDGPRAIWHLWRLFRREHFDIIQYSTPNASLYTAIAAAMAGSRVRVYAQWGVRYVAFTGLKRHLFKLIEWLICTLSTDVEPDSFGNLAFAIREGLYPAAKGHVHWNGSAAGVDLEEFDLAQKRTWRLATRERLGIDPDSFVLGFVGRLNRDKGGNELLTAARDLLDSGYDLRLVLVGTIEEGELDRSLLTWAFSEPRIISTGHSARVPEYMAAIDALALPSYREGFGSVVIEAEAMGIPVIVTDIPGPLDAIEPNVTGLVIPARDAGRLRDAIRTLADDTRLRQQMGRRGVEFAATHFQRPVLLRKILEWRERQISGWSPRGHRNAAS